MTTGHDRYNGVPDRGQDTEDESGEAAEAGQGDGLGEELVTNLAAGGAEGTAQADLTSAFEDGDHHGVRDADAADEQGDRGHADEEAGEGSLRGALRGERVRGAADLDQAGILRCDRLGQNGVHVLHGALVRLDEQLGRTAVKAQLGACGLPADQDRAIDIGGERDAAKDADDAEPAAAEQHLRGRDARDQVGVAQAGGGDRAEHRGRNPLGGLGQVAARPDLRAQDFGEVASGRPGP
jgi:hypothetical protein